MGTRSERLEIFPLKVTEPLALVKVLGLPDQAESARGLLGYLHHNGITTPFLSEAAGRRGCRDLVFAVDDASMERIDRDLEALQEALRAEVVRVEKPVALIRILGPHFDIRPGVAGLLFGRMESAGINVLASSTTITTTLVVVHQSQSEELSRVLKSTFIVPGHK